VEDDTQIVNKTAKPNFKAIGPKYGKLVKPLTNAIKELNKDQISVLEHNGTLTLTIENTEVVITKEEVEIVSHEIEGWLVESEEGVTVAIDTELTEALIAEGYAREFVNRVQNMRKDAGFDVIDRIRVFIDADLKLIDYVNQFKDYICNEILADGIFYSGIEGADGHEQEFEIGEHKLRILVAKSN
jgi:isoleucyl-tRNA synthetase